MASNKPHSTLRVIAQQAALIVDDGDIILPLKRLRDQYTHKAEEIDEKMPGKGATDEKDKAKRASMLVTAARYRRAADSVQRLIGVLSVTDFVEPSAPVDQTEEILSDVPWKDCGQGSHIPGPGCADCRDAGVAK